MIIPHTPSRISSPAPQRTSSQSGETASVVREQDGPQDSFAQNVGQFVEGALPFYGLTKLNKAAETESVHGIAGVFLGQAFGSSALVLAGLQCASEGIAPAAIGFGLAALALTAAGVSNASINYSAANAG